MHAKGIGPTPFPLLFSHGWPGSFWEVHKIIGPLTDPAAHGGDPADAFHVVAPSLPGFGFSRHPGRPGIGLETIADMFDQLMVKALGYHRYGAQGGDWGAVIASRLGRDHAETVAGIHLNLGVTAPLPDRASAPLTQAEQDFLHRLSNWRAEESAYSMLQGTKPSTIAAGLSDSPAGLAAWMVEKFRSWSDCGGDMESVFTKDELLTNITLYWLTNTAATSARLYYEAYRASRNPFAVPGYVVAPTGFASFPKEFATPPREWVARSHNLQRFTTFDHTGATSRH